MTDALNPEPLLRALHDAGVQHIIIASSAALPVNAHRVISPSRDLHVVPDPDPANLERLAMLLANLHARHVGLGDFHADEFPVDPTSPEDLRSGANFRLETSLGDLGIMQWVPASKPIRLMPRLSPRRSKANSTACFCASAASTI